MSKNKCKLLKLNIMLKSKNNKKCVLLCRVSTPGQELDPQIEDLQKYAESLGYSEYHLVETKESGLINYKNREGTNELFEFLKVNQEYKTVICTEMSRLGRTEADLHCMKEWFIKNKVQFHLKDRNYQLFDEDFRVNDSAALAFSIYGYAAESEMRTKKDRFRRAKIYWQGMGISITGKLLFGYKRVSYDKKRKTYSIDEEQAEEIQKIFYWYANGIDSTCPNPSIKDIVIHCIKKGFSNYTHSKRNVNKLLKEEAYLGFKTTNNKRKNPYYTVDGNESMYITSKTEIKYPIILNKDLFDSVQEKLKTNNSKAEKSSKHITILAKLIICPECLRFLGGEYSKKKHGVIRYGYRCLATKNIIKCEYTKYFSMQMMDSIVWSTIKSDLTVLSNEIFENNPDNILKTLKEEEENLKIRQKKLEERFSAEVISFDKIRRMRNFNIDEQLAKFDITMDKLQTEKDDVDQAINSIQVRLKIMETEKVQNYKQIILNNIKKIEEDKELIKHYISLFVQNINILYHDLRHTILEINFNKTSDDVFNRLNQKLTYAKDLPIEKKTKLIIDKTITQNIQIRKITRSFKLNENHLTIVNNRFGHIETFDFTLDEIFKPNEKTYLKAQKVNYYPLDLEYYDLFTPIIYFKLDLYPVKLSE